MPILWKRLMLKNKFNDFKEDLHNLKSDIILKNKNKRKKIVQVSSTTVLKNIDNQNIDNTAKKTIDTKKTFQSKDILQNIWDLVDLNDMKNIYDNISDLNKPRFYDIGLKYIFLISFLKKIWYNDINNDDYKKLFDSSFYEDTRTFYDLAMKIDKQIGSIWIQTSDYDNQWKKTLKWIWNFLNIEDINIEEVLQNIYDLVLDSDVSNLLNV